MILLAITSLCSVWLCPSRFITLTSIVSSDYLLKFAVVPPNRRRSEFVVGCFTATIFQLVSQNFSMEVWWNVFGEKTRLTREFYRYAKTVSKSLTITDRVKIYKTLVLSLLVSTKRQKKKKRKKTLMKRCASSSYDIGQQRFKNYTLQNCCTL